MQPRSGASPRITGSFRRNVKDGSGVQATDPAKRKNALHPAIVSFTACVQGTLCRRDFRVLFGNAALKEYPGGNHPENPEFPLQKRVRIPEPECNPSDVGISALPAKRTGKARLHKKGRAVSDPARQSPVRDQDYAFLHFLLYAAMPARPEPSRSMVQGSGTGADAETWAPVTMYPVWSVR